MAERKLDQKALLPLFQCGAIEPHELAGSYSSQRDAVARALVTALSGRGREWRGGGGWGGVLAQVCPPREGGEYSYLDGRDYLSFLEVRARTGGTDEAFKDPRLREGDELVILGGMVGGVWWKDLTRAVVIGSVGLVNCPSLERVDLTVLGNLNISNCPKLRHVSGEVFGDANLYNCGLESLGADFRVAGRLSLVGCPDLRRLNCDVGGDFQSSGCGEILIGPAFKTKSPRDVGRPSDLRRGLAATQMPGADKIARGPV